MAATRRGDHFGGTGGAHRRASVPVGAARATTLRALAQRAHVIHS
jgi:hypothetical protein